MAEVYSGILNVQIASAEVLQCTFLLSFYGKNQSGRYVQTPFNAARQELPQTRVIQRMRLLLLVVSKYGLIKKCARVV